MYSFCTLELISLSLPNSLLRVFQITMSPRKVIRGRPARRNVEAHEQKLPNAPDVQPQGEVTNAKFWEAIRMLSYEVTNQVRQYRGA